MYHYQGVDFRATKTGETRNRANRPVKRRNRHHKRKKGAFNYRLKLISGLILAKKSSKYLLLAIIVIFFKNEFTVVII